jgi:hypothetical protein
MFPEDTEFDDEPLNLMAVQEDDKLLDQIVNYDGPDMFLSILSSWAQLHRNGT